MGRVDKTVKIVEGLLHLRAKFLNFEYEINSLLPQKELEGSDNSEELLGFSLQNWEVEIEIGGNERVFVAIEDNPNVGFDQREGFMVWLYLCLLPKMFQRGADVVRSRR